MHPRLVDPEVPQRRRKLVHVATRAEEGRGTLEEREAGAVLRDRRHQRRGGRARADDDDRLFRIGQILRPGLGMDDHALERVDPRPLRRVPFRLAVVALTHPEEAGAELDGLRDVGPRRLDRPAFGAAGPRRRADRVPIADMRSESVLLDDLAHVLEDLGRRRDRRAAPWLEPEPVGVEVRIGSDAGISVGMPSPPEARLGVEDDEARPWALRPQVIGGGDPGDAGADDQHIVMVARRWVGGRAGIRLVQGRLPAVFPAQPPSLGNALTVVWAARCAPTCIILLRI